MTNIRPNELKELLLLCTQNATFSFNKQFYLQKSVIAMGSSLAPVIAGSLIKNWEEVYYQYYIFL